jgi:hypothetical protein
MELSDDSKMICGMHGSVQPAYVCRHIVLNAPSPAGFIAPEPDAEDPDLQAWCSACDIMLEAEGDWTESVQAFADIRLVCEFCFEQLRAQHAGTP